MYKDHPLKLSIINHFTMHQNNLLILDKNHLHTLLKSQFHKYLTNFKQQQRSSLQKSQTDNHRQLL